MVQTQKTKNYFTFCINLKNVLEPNKTYDIYTHDLPILEMFCYIVTIIK